MFDLILFCAEHCSQFTVTDGEQDSFRLLSPTLFPACRGRRNADMISNGGYENWRSVR